MASLVRVGIDVGGTFTHAVAIDGTTLALLGKAKVPTTHRAAEGVARGIINSLHLLLSEANIAPENVGFIAHSTTQATNALLEGDVATVGIIGMGKGASAWLSNMATDVGQIKLAPGKYLKTHHRFLDTSKPLSRTQIEQTINNLLKAGAQVIAISEAFSVDESENELAALAVAQEMGLYATAGSQVSQLYGLRIRTRTAVLNASMLPKMIESADMTETSVREAGIKAPVMIMRSDGGVMDIDSMRKKPILTILSGPAAGVAAAMMYLHISDGIFLEVGGTSTDISAIRNGKALVRSAEIGGHRIFLRTLDVRTVGIAGGSMLRMDEGRLVDVGPRSAHIAGLKYASFSEPLADPRLHKLQPKPGDPSDYLAFSEGDSQPAICLTPTCASNLLGLVSEHDCARGSADAAKSAFVATGTGSTNKPEALATQVLDVATGKCWPVVKQLIKDYKLDAELTDLIGGGGGAASLVPFLAQKQGMRYSLAENADVVSAIGVALALLRETVERQISHPDSDAILRVRQEAHAAVERMGADPATIEVQVEVDSKTNIVRATAHGATSLTEVKETKRRLSDEERIGLVAESMRVQRDKVSLSCQTEHFYIYQAEAMRSHLCGLLRTTVKSLRVVDETGVVRLQIRHGEARSTPAREAEKVISALAEEHAQYGDAGRILPTMMLLSGTKIIDLSGLLDLSQIVAVAKIELERVPSDTSTLVIASLD